MTESTKFEVIDRRKYKADDEEHQTPPAAEPAAQKPAAAPQPVAVPQPESAPSAGPRLVESPQDAAAEAYQSDEELLAAMPPPPTAEETREQKTAYDASADRLEDLVRAQNPAMGAPEPVTFESLVQQLYYSAMLQMGAGGQQGQQVRVDVIGARQSIDLLGVLAEKTRGNLTEAEDRVLQTVLYEARMGFLEVTRMITLQGVKAPPPAPGPRK